MNLLLEAGADVNKASKRGETALMCVADYATWIPLEKFYEDEDKIAAAYAEQDTKSLIALNILLAARADVNKTNKGGYSALLFAKTKRTRGPCDKAKGGRGRGKLWLRNNVTGVLI